MRTTRAAIICGLLMMLPASAPAQSNAGKTAPATMHATRGVVKFVDAHTLIITRSPRHGKELSFTLTPSTERVGELMVGCIVDVRYRSQAKQMIATAVTVEHLR